jgi:hypothetical protein
MEPYVLYETLATYGITLMLPLFVMGRWHPTDEARQLAQAVREELDAMYPRKVSADILRLKQSDLSLQLNCAEPLNFFRLAALGPVFWQRILKRLATLYGGAYLEPEVVTLLRGAAELGQPVIDERKRA